MYPSYNSSSYFGDIAMLTLSSDADFTNYVTPVCLWEERSDDLDDIVEKEGTVRTIFFATYYESLFNIVVICTSIINLFADTLLFYALPSATFLCYIKYNFYQYNFLYNFFLKF